jgi:hypothetical protein
MHKVIDPGGQVMLELLLHFQLHLGAIPEPVVE